MDIEVYRNYCLGKRGVTESFPFNEEVLVFKVMNKMFASSNINKRPFSVNLKCNPEKALQYRELYEGVQPGYHMNKKHWNTINFESNLSEKKLQYFINHSYELVVSKLTKKEKEQLAQL